MGEGCKQSLCWAPIFADVILARASGGRSAEVTRTSPERKQSCCNEQLIADRQCLRTPVLHTRAHLVLLFPARRPVGSQVGSPLGSPRCLSVRGGFLSPSEHLGSSWLAYAKRCWTSLICSGPQPFLSRS